MNQHTESTPQQRYPDFIILLHWVMALGILIMLGSGVIMTYAPLTQSQQFTLYQWHKSAGVLLLIAAAIRIITRLFAQHKQRIPPLPQTIPAREIIASHLGHFGLYALILFMPLSGWLMVSASIYGLPTYLFGWFEWPHLPGLAQNELVESVAKDSHFYGAILLGLLLAGHLGAVIKHKLHEGVNLIPRMTWPEPPWRLLASVVTSLFAAGTLISLSQTHLAETKRPVASNGAEGGTTQSNQGNTSRGNYFVLKNQSTIQFSGSNAGDAFTGTIQEWVGEFFIYLDDLAKSSVTVEFDMSSAATGNPMYDETLTESDWFDTTQFPTASYKSSNIQFDRTKGFFSEGELTLKGIVAPLVLQFTTSDLKGDPVTLKTTFEIDRLHHNVGVESDPSADWVSQFIALEVTIALSPTPPNSLLNLK